MSKPYWTSPVVSVIAAVIFIGLFCIVFAPNSIHSGPGKMSGIFNNLRQIDGATEEWVLEHHKTGAVVVTREDLAPYMGRGTGSSLLDKSLYGERYLLGNLAGSASAELTREVAGRPKGTILTFDTNGNEQYIFPNQPR